jgi:hypothetical protein
MKILVLVIVSFDKPVYYDMLRVWRERILTIDCCVTDVWFIQCKSDAEWVGDIVNDIGDKRSGSLKNPPLCGQSQSQNVSDFESLGSQSLGSSSLGSQSLGSSSLESQSIVSQSLGSQSLGSSSLKDRFELDIANKTLFIRGDECLIPGILHKTVEALSYFLRERSSLIIPPYNFVWRTNLSSVLDFEGLQRYLGTINSSGFYGGYVGKALSGATISGATVSKDIFFASGAGFLMSRDVAEYLVLNRDSLRWDLIDDVAIGALLEPRYGIVPIDRCWIQSGEEVVGSHVANGVFHYRCESYQHLRTVEFMQYVVRGLSE